MNYAAVVRSYQMRNQPRAEREISYYRSKSFRDAVAAAALAHNFRGKRHSHQRWIPQPSLEMAQQILLENIERLKSCTDFHRLLKLVDTLVADISGLGELYTYDTALPIGVNAG